MSELANIDLNILRHAYQMFLQAGTPEINRFSIDLPEHNFHKHPGEFLHLWEFLYELLKDGTYIHIIRWYDYARGMFTILRTEEVAFLWGKHKRKPSMNFDKLARALRYYYDRGIMSKVTELGAPKYTFQFGRLDILAHPTEAMSSPPSPRVKHDPDSAITPEEHEKNLRAIAAITAGFPLDPEETAGGSATRESHDRDSVSTTSIDVTAMGDSNSQQQGLPDGATLMAAMSSMVRGDDGQGNNNAELQKLYADYFSSTSSNQNPLVQVLKTWYQQSNMHASNPNAPMPQQHRPVNLQPTFSAPMHTMNPASMIPTPTYLPPPPPVQHFENKKRRIDDLTEKISKRPRPMVIPAHVELRKALGVPKNGATHFGHYKAASSYSNPSSNTDYRNNCYQAVSQNTYHPISQSSSFIVPSQQNIAPPPVLSPIRANSPVTTTTDSTTSTISSCPQIDLCGSVNDSDRQSPTVSIEDEKPGAGNDGDDGVQGLVDQLLKVIDGASTKTTFKHSTDLCTAIATAQEQHAEAGSLTRVATYFKVHELLAGKTTLSPDEKTLFDAVNLVLINQVVRPVFAESDSGISDS